MTKLETIQAVYTLVNQLALLNVEEATAKIKVPNDNVLKLVGAELNCHIFEPYESFENESRFFDYKAKNIRITVESEDRYRKSSQLISY